MVIDHHKRKKVCDDRLARVVTENAVGLKYIDVSKEAESDRIFRRVGLRE